MLDKKDLEAIGALLDTRLQKTETDLRNEMHTMEGMLRDEMHTIEGTLRDEMHTMEGTLRDEMHTMEGTLRDEMHTVEGTLRDEMHTVEGALRDEMHTIEGTLRDEIQQAEQRMKWFTELKIKESEELLLEDADWTKSRLEAKIDAVDKKIEEIQEYYRIRKLNDDTTALLAKRIDRLEQKIAARS